MLGNSLEQVIVVCLFMVDVSSERIFDGTDVKAALQESLRRVWNGDVDLLDGKLEDIRREYEVRISGCETITKFNNICREDLVIAFGALVDALEDDIVIIITYILYETQLANYNNKKFYYYQQG